MAEELKKTIIVKKIKKGGGGHHGGAWKIAYADFVTAMMAFFLLMWLLGSTSKAQKAGISDYFKTPLMVAIKNTGGPAVGASDSIMKDTGGKDITKKQGQVKPDDGSKGKEKSVDIKEAEEAMKKAETAKLEELKEKMEKAISDSPELSKFKNQLLMDLTSEGLRVQIVDEQNRPMFNSSKADMQPYARKILQEIGKVLNGVNNKVSLSGHTDAVPYAGGEAGYSNWELSSDRANASRREMIAGGMDESKIVRVVGLGSASLFDKDNPFNPTNRRISIIVMNKQAEEDALKDSAEVKLPSNAQAPEIDEAVAKE
ncbi:MAG TPA: flagellar motor protein MotB [Methylophilaceae bacterium]|nr:flagellar motor protein MotB [Methylophilaceae bacterium]HPX89651.1 flagellar motor protein MotB [Methylophilaceae bacterium]HQC29197.1 flagellar motor protein MotB [Methylotenera sp.]